MVWWCDGVMVCKVTPGPPRATPRLRCSGAHCCFFLFSLRAQPGTAALQSITRRGTIRRSPFQRMCQCPEVDTRSGARAQPEDGRASSECAPRSSCCKVTPGALPAALRREVCFPESEKYESILLCVHHQKLTETTNVFRALV